MFDRPINVFGSMMVWWTDAAVEMVPRSDRKTYRARRPDYRGAHRKMATTGWPRHVANIRSSRRCVPRLIAKPAIYRMGGKLLVHPAMRAEFERHFGLQR